MQFALGDAHGIFITTPKDFPDPAPEAEKIRKVGCVCWGWLVGWLGLWVEKALPNPLVEVSY